MSAALNKPSALQDTNAVAADDGAETVGNHDGCGTLFGLEKLVDALLHNRLALTVQCTGCFVKQHHVGPPDEAAGDAKSLPLAATQLHGRHAGADQSIVAVLAANVSKNYDVQFEKGASAPAGSG